MAKRNFIELFESRKGHLDYRLKRDYVRNGIAAIPCRVSDYHDDVQLSMQAGLNAHLSKPVDPEALFETLEKLIR